MTNLDPLSEFDVELTGSRAPSWTSSLLRNSGAAMLDVDAYGQCLACYDFLWFAEIKTPTSRDFKWEATKRLARIVAAGQHRHVLAFLVIEDRVTGLITIENDFNHAVRVLTPEEYVAYFQSIRAAHKCRRTKMDTFKVVAE